MPESKTLAFAGTVAVRAWRRQEQRRVSTTRYHNDREEKKKTIALIINRVKK